jgi:hypothetical protein
MNTQIERIRDDLRVFQKKERGTHDQHVGITIASERNSHLTLNVPDSGDFVAKLAVARFRFRINN